YDAGELLVLIQCLQRFGKYHVCAGFDVSGSSIDRGLLAFHRMCVGACHDDEVAIRAPIHGSLDPIDHFFRGYQGLAWPMATPLGGYLIFQMHASSTGLDEIGAGPRDVERASPTRIGIDQ